MILKLIIVCLLCLAIVVILYFAGVLIYATLTEFNPGPIEIIPVEKDKMEVVHVQNEFNLLSWNIGYGGLGKEMDFFYEGGKMVMPSNSLYSKYMNGVSDFIISMDSVDFFLLQEVDFHSKRSYSQNQAQILFSNFNNRSFTTALNYKSAYVPVPYLNPMGKVNSGLVTWSKLNPYEAQRISSPASYNWPKKLFLPKRCLLTTRYKVESGHDLVVINLHNSAFDDADALRDEELKLIRKFALDEYTNGNYVLAGGDWNQNPPGLKITINGGYKLKPLRPIPADLMPEGWNWAFDPSLPTNRDVDKPFDNKTTNCTTIDFFLASPNIEVLKTQTLDLGFEYSDHLPVILQIRLKGE